MDAGTEVVWEKPPRLEANRTVLAVPRASGALPLVVAMERLNDIDDAGVSFGVGDPTVLLLATPDCGCDACDSGSQDALDELDEYMLSVVTGSYRRIWRDKKKITVISEGHRGSSWSRRKKIDKILANPKGWNELSGMPWFSEEQV